ncbi:MAG TPA: hypothetical protein VGE07_20105 [Herpetosiphonaceae bacterium]
MYQAPRPATDREPLFGPTFLAYLLYATAGTGLFTLAKFGGLAVRYWQVGCTTGDTLYFMVLGPPVLLLAGLATRWLSQRWLPADDWRRPLAPVLAFGHALLLAAIILTALNRSSVPYLEPQTVFGVTLC